MPYPPLEDIVALSPQLEALTPEQQQALYDASILAIETYCGQSFADAVDEAIEVQTVRDDTLYLPKRLIVIESIVPLGGDPLEIAAIAITHDGARLVWKRNVVGVGYYEQALQEVSGYSYPTAFSEGWATITGTWGWVDCPVPVAQALAADMIGATYTASNDLTATVGYMRSMGIERISQGNLDLALAPMPTMSPTVAALLENFVFRGTPPGRLV